MSIFLENNYWTNKIIQKGLKLGVSLKNHTCIVREGTIENHPAEYKCTGVGYKPGNFYQRVQTTQQSICLHPVINVIRTQPVITNWH